MVNLLRKFRASAGGSFLARLRGDRAGNVLALVATCVPPILLLVGGGIDMSRAYMAQTALQNACDAGVLAGRRASAKSGTFGTAEQAKSSKMFNFNFNGTSQSANATGTSFVPADTGSGVISATASTTVPTTIMKIFGTNSFALSATCSAEFQISNIDVMMVLDTTGSMACEADGSDCDSDSDSKIAGLKSAIRSFYYTIAAAVPAASTTRVRFGFVPYAGAVNMQNLVTAGDIPQGYLSSATPYQTKLYKFDKPILTGGTSSAPVITYETYSSAISESNCSDYADNDYPDSGANPVSTGTAPAAVTTKTYSLSSWTKTGSTDDGGKAGGKGGDKGGGKGGGGDGTDIGTCVRKVSTVTTSGQTITAYGLSDTPYRYTQSTVDTSVIKAGTAVSLATSVNSSSTVPAAGYTTGYYDMVALGALSGTTNITRSNYTWTGCIEERATVNSLISAAAIPAGATDLDLATAPTTTASTQWKPYVSNLVFDRGQAATLDTTSNIASMAEYCVPPAMKYTTVDTTNKTTVPTWLESYITSLYAWGGTYHDIGMIWGARLANPNGIMSANVNSGSLTSVSRHIIFLTDGEMSPYCNSLYSSYGLEDLDNRVAPPTTLTGTNCNNYLKPYHNGRYLAACQRAKDMGYTVWVIGFGQSVTTEMTACASSGRSYYASDTATLQTTFRTIAAQVADLRLKS